MKFRPMKESSRTGFRATKAYDVLIAAPLIIFYAVSMAGLQPQFESAWRLQPAWLAILKLADLSSDVLYFALVIALIFLRRVPVGRTAGLLPRALAIAGSLVLLVLPFLQLVKVIQPVSLTPPLVGASTLLTAGGTIAELAILSWLGRSFSLMPEARKLVSSGPYATIRHPLYLTGMIASIGVMLQFQQPWALIVVAAAFALQLARMHFEEEILMRTFPQYAEYMARTSRLIPRVY